MFKRLFRKRNFSRQSLKSRNEELIVQTNPKSPVTEAFRNIRTNLSFVSPDNPIKTLVVTSSVASEGKSFVLANMSLSTAQNGKRVIIIDADMRKPMVHKFFDLPNTSGLSNILSGKVGLDEVLRETDIDGVRVITAGNIPPNPAELLGSRKMEEVLEKACNDADIVFVDTPPVVVVTDAVILANKVDGTILVTASHQTEQKVLVKAKEILDKAQARVVGVVLNKYSTGHKSKNEYYYYGQ